MKMPADSPEYLQTSTAAAMTMKFLPGKFHRGAKLNALNLLLTYEDGCKAKCSYCGLSKSRDVEEEDRTFIRVDWPSYQLDDIISRTKKHGKHIQRVCVSMITHAKALDDMCYVMKRFKDETDLLISGLISPTMIKDKETIQHIKDAGADMVGVALDAVSPELFEEQLV
jgi:biotin synthase